MATNPPTNPKVPLPPPPALEGPHNYKVDAGQTVVLVDDKNKVVLFKQFIFKTHIFSDWTFLTYADLATAQAAVSANVAANKWTVDPSLSSKIFPPSAPATPSK